MKLNLYDENLVKIAVIEGQFVSCLWSEKYNSMGSFALELQETDNYKKIIRPNIYVKRQDRKTLMLIKTVEIQNGKIIANGFPATKVLSDVVFVGKINTNSVIASSLKMAYNSSNKFNKVEFADSLLTDRYTEQISNKTMLELAETMCQKADIGLRAVKDNNSIAIELYKPPVNKNAVFSEFIGNITNTSLTLSTANYKNYAIVLGQGEEESRVRIDVDLSNGEQRRELLVDARDLQKEETETLEDYKKRLKARGTEKLLEQIKTWNCKFEPLAIDFGSKYDLGDIVTVVLNSYDIKLQARIMAFKQKEQKNKTETTVEVGSLTIIKR